MELVIRGAIIYLFLFVVIRASGNRQLSQITAFDAILLLIIAEATQQALLGEDFSLTAAIILVTTLVFIDIVLSFVRQWSPTADRIMDGVPVVLIDEGEMLKDQMNRERVDEDDLMTAARSEQGLERLDDVKYAVLERDGRISIIPWPAGEERPAKA
jgi:uncharacterized membrane protein YcaP (DUF421 family)